jgi:ferritin
MLDERMQDALNGQINAELYSAYLYLSMSAQFAEIGLAGGQNWMHVQFQEELFHVQKFFDYVVERGGRVRLTTIQQPTQEWPSALAMFETTLQHEQKVTGLINGLADLALELRDHATLQELQWFIGEQVEEEASADDMVKKLRLVQGAPGGLYEIDKELAARVYTPPIAAQA